MAIVSKLLWQLNQIAKTDISTPGPGYSLCYSYPTNYSDPLYGWVFTVYQSLLAVDCSASQTIAQWQPWQEQIITPCQGPSTQLTPCHCYKTHSLHQYTPTPFRDPSKQPTPCQWPSMQPIPCQGPSTQPTPCQSLSTQPTPCGVPIQNSLIVTSSLNNQLLSRVQVHNQLLARVNTFNPVIARIPVHNTFNVKKEMMTNLDSALFQIT